MDFIKNTGRKKYQKGATRRPQASLPGAAYPLGAPRWLVVPRLRLWLPSCAIRRVSFQKKSRRRLSGGLAAATRRNLSRTNLEHRQCRPAGETSLPEGEIVAIVIIKTPLIGGDSSPSTSSSASSHLQTLVHLL